MLLVDVIVVLILLGVLINTFAAMDGPTKTVINVIVMVLCLWLLVLVNAGNDGLLRELRR